jgi:glycine cleavage system H protein
VNEDCWGKAWMIAIAPDDPAAAEGLLDAAAYSAHLEEAAH